MPLQSRRSNATKRDYREKDKDRDRDARGRNRGPRESSSPRYQSSSADPRKEGENGPKRAPSVDPTKPRKPPRKPRPQPSPPPEPEPQPSPPPEPKPQPPPDTMLNSTPNYYSKYQTDLAGPVSLPAIYEVACNHPEGVATAIDFQAGSASKTTPSTPLTINIRVHGKLIEAEVDLAVKESFVSNRFATSLNTTQNTTRRRRTYQKFSGKLLTSRTKIETDILFEDKSIRSELYVLDGRVDHDLVLGKKLWTALQPQVRDSVLESQDEQREYSESSYSISSLSIGGTDVTLTSSSIYPPSPQEAHSQRGSYGSETLQPTTDSQQTHPVASQYSTLDVQAPYETPLTHARPSQYTSSNPPKLPTYQDYSRPSVYGSPNPQGPDTYSAYSNYATKGSQEPYSSTTRSSYDSYNVATSAYPTTYNTSYTAPDSHSTSSENYTYKSASDNPVSTSSYQSSPRQGGQQTTLHTTSPGENPYDEAEQQDPRSETYYASVPEWKYQS